MIRMMVGECRELEAIEEECCCDPMENPLAVGEDEPVVAVVVGEATAGGVSDVGAAGVEVAGSGVEGADAAAEMAGGALDDDHPRENLAKDQLRS